MSRSKFTYIDKLDAVTDFLEGRKGAAQIQSDLGISDATLYTWVGQF